MTKKSSQKTSPSIQKTFNSDSKDEIYLFNFRELCDVCDEVVPSKFIEMDEPKGNIELIEGGEGIAIS